MTRRLSLRAKTTAAGTLVAAVVLVAGAFVLVVTLEDRLVSSTDGLSRSRVEDLLDAAASRGVPDVLVSVGDNGVAQVVDGRGRVVAASANVVGRPAVTTARSRDQAVETLVGPDDGETERYRVWYRTETTPAGTFTAYVGDSLESAQEASATLRRSLAVAVPAAVAVLALSLWLLLGRALGRLDRIRSEVDTITDRRLDVRVEADGADDEVGRLARTMNSMLGRIETAAQRQRDFVADVSHDLRGPLASQRVALELALQGRDDAVDRELLRSEVLAATTEMEALVDDLLQLAAADADVPRPAQPVDLDEIVLEEASRARWGPAVTITTTAVGAAPAYADPTDVRRIVRNLLGNAVAHAASEVRLSVAEAAGPVPAAVLDVIDDGPGIDPAEAELVFERFYRGDAARTRGGGRGLGLAIARGLARAGGGDVVLVADGGPGAHLRLTVPAPPVPQPPPVTQAPQG